MNMTDIKFYVQVFVRRLPYFLVTFLFIAAAGISVAVMMPAVYKASSTILVEPGQISEDLAQSTVEVVSTQALRILQRHLTSRDTLLEVAERQSVFKNAEELTDLEKAQVMQSRLIFDVIESDDRRSPAPTVVLSFEAPDPELAAGVANEFVDLMLEENQRLRTARASETLEFFEQEVERLGAELQGVSNEILSFKNENIEALPESLAFRRAEQTRLQQRLVQLDRESATLREARAKLIEVFESTGQVLDPSRGLTPNEEELRRLRNELDQALAVFSPSNPRVTMLRNQVAALERRVTAEGAGASDEDDQTQDSGTGGGVSLQVREYDAQLAQLDGEAEKLRTELAELSETIRATPINEVRLGTLERHYENVQKQYNAAVDNLASAATGERIEALSKGERFTVLEEAAPPSSPDRPNRKLLAAGSVAAGLFAGLALVVLLEFLNGAIRRPVDLERKLNIQAFGAVPYIRTRREMLVKRLLIGSAVVTAVVILPLATYAVHVYYMPLDQLLLQVTRQAGTGVDAPAGNL